MIALKLTQPNETVEESGGPRGGRIGVPGDPRPAQLGRGEMGGSRGIAVPNEAVEESGGRGGRIGVPGDPAQRGRGEMGGSRDMAAPNETVEAGVHAAASVCLAIRALRRGQAAKWEGPSI